LNTSCGVEFGGSFYAAMIEPNPIATAIIAILSKGTPFISSIT